MIIKELYHKFLQGTPVNISTKVYADNLFINVTYLIEELLITNKMLLKTPENSHKFLYDLFEQILIDKLNSIVSFASPSVLIYFSLDGVLPKSNIFNKRQKNYLLNTNVCPVKNSVLRSGTLTKSFDLYFSVNELNPDTPFMVRIRESLEKYIRGFTNLKIIFSNDLAPSSADNKIISYIRKNYKTDQKNFVYSNCEEMYYFSVFTCKKHIYIFNQDSISSIILNSLGSADEARDCVGTTTRSNTNHKFVVFNNQQLINSIYNYFSKKLNYLDLDKYNLICDIATVSFLLGSFFITPMYNSDISGLINSYEVYLAEYLEYISSDFKINFSSLRNFILLAQKTCHLEEIKYPNEYLNITKEHENFQEHKVYNYIKSLLWGYLYFSKNCPSYSWGYMYYTAPSVNEILTYFTLNAECLDKIYFYYINPCSIAQQVLSVSTKLNVPKTCQFRENLFPTNYYVYNNKCILNFNDPYKII